VSAQLYRLDTLISEARIELRTNEEFPNSPAIVCPPASFTALTFDAQSVAVAFDGNDNVYVLNRLPTRLDVIPISSAAMSVSAARKIRLNDPPMRDLGHEWFHAERDGSGVSCAACHAEGMDDGHVWRSRQGPRRTPSLRGGLSQTAPFGWGGQHTNLDSIIRRFAEGRVYARVPEEAISGMGKWLDKLPALSLQPATEQDSLAATSGKVLFESAELGCAGCHSGALLTNNQTVEVGTGAAFQVPTLTGLALRAPYMHDGCAKDLRALFTDRGCAGQVHAQLAALSDGDAASLLSYLQAL
jgi:cytochrome c peroxidase